MLSICIPTLNRADLLEKNLKHLLTFKDLDIEVNISNNGSTDHTLAVIDKYKNKFEKFNFVSYEETIDVISNWDSAIRLATQKYVFALADDDNSIEEGLLAATNMLNENDELLLVYGGCIEYDLQENFLANTKKCDQTEMYDQRNRLELVQKHWSFEVPVFRNSFYQDYAQLHENSWILSWNFLSKALKIGKVAATPYFFFKHYIHKNRITETNASDSHMNFVGISEMEMFLADTPGDPNLKYQALINYYVRLYSFHAAVCIRNNNLLQARFFIAKGMFYHQDFISHASNWDKSHLVRASAQEIKQRIHIKDFIKRVILISVNEEQAEFLKLMFEELYIDDVMFINADDVIPNYNDSKDFLVFFDDTLMPDYTNKQNVVAFNKVMNSLKFTDNEIKLNL